MRAGLHRPGWCFAHHPSWLWHQESATPNQPLASAASQGITAPQKGGICRRRMRSAKWCSRWFAIWSRRSVGLELVESKAAWACACSRSPCSSFCSKKIAPRCLQLFSTWRSLCQSGLAGRDAPKACFTSRIINMPSRVSCCSCALLALSCRHLRMKGTHLSNASRIALSSPPPFVALSVALFVALLALLSLLALSLAPFLSALAFLKGPLLCVV